MFSNYFKISLRNLLSQRLYTLINILGLAVGIACCMMIMIFVIDELSYDRYHEKSDRIFRTYVDMKIGEVEGDFAVLPAPLAPTLMRDFPEVEAAGRFRAGGAYLVKRNPEDENIEETEIIFADHEIFEIFTIPLIEGDPETLLKEPQTLVLSESAAQKYFKGESALNQTLILDNEETYKVVGVVEDIPDQSHFHFDIFLSMEGREESKNGIWLSHNFQTYLLLKEGANAEALEAKFPELIETHAGPQVMQFLGVSMEEWENGGNRIGYHLQPLSKVHLHTSMEGDLEPSGSMTFVYIFSVIALFILFIACINFMNLSTARSSNRAREVGVRKVLGAFKKQLVSQFLVESIIMSMVAFMLAIIIAEITLPYFSNLSGKSLYIPWNALLFIPTVLLGAIIVGLLAGAYPALFLSSFKPIQVLKGKLNAGAKSSRLRGVLVVFQFATSIILIICTLVVQRQLSFIQNKKLGFKKEQVAYIRNTYVIGDQIQAFKKELQHIPQITEATISGYLPVQPSSRNNTAFWPEGKRVQEETIIMQNWAVDFDYMSTLGMEIIEGRAFDINQSTDSTAIVINKAAVKSFGFENPVGERISTFESIDEETGEPSMITYHVIGVMEDFHYESLRNAIGPLCLYIGRSTSRVSFRFQTGEDISTTLASVEEKWKEFAPNQPFDYSFLDESFRNMYDSEQRLSKIFSLFAGLSIFVACLGLFALASYMAEQRTKEIGIRKVMGATVSDIISLLSQDFMRLVLISILLAVPVAWWFMHQWLEGFEYRTNIQAGIFITAGLAAIIISLLTVTYQSLRAALTNPVDALRDE